MGNYEINYNNNQKLNLIKLVIRLEYKNILWIA